MDIQGKRVLVLGGYGEVGTAVCRALLDEEPAECIIGSLREEETSRAIETLTPETPSNTKLTGTSGNMFVRRSLKDMTREEILANHEYLQMVARDTLEELTEEILTESTLYRAITTYRPDIIVDSMNTATGIAYLNIFQMYGDVARQLTLPGIPEGIRDEINRIFSTVSIPPLIRHIQILYESMVRAGTAVYLKIGTTGTGGMGFNIPFTHGEERPSRVLMTKTAVAGAHTFLLFLLGRTPGGPVVKELKPASLIGWKGIGKGQIFKGTKPIPLYDSPSEGHRLVIGETFNYSDLHVGDTIDGKTLEGVYVDTGENGVFSPDEFKTLTTIGLMEMITPEDIARETVAQIRGVNTSKEMIGAVNGAIMGPTYRGGLLRQQVINKMDTLGDEGIAYELVGPPRVTKLIFEAHLLRYRYKTMEQVVTEDPILIARELESEVAGNASLRRSALSIGIPVLLSDGATLLFASRSAPDKHWETESWTVSPENIDKWTHNEWIDLRPHNIHTWQSRFKSILLEAECSSCEGGSHFDRGKGFWRSDDKGNTLIDPGEAAGWVLIHEDKGSRYPDHRLDMHIRNGQDPL